MLAPDLSKQNQSISPLERVIHLPDKGFIDWCMEEAAINRGVFNVIDQWFFDYGLKDIIMRREVIISFLRYLNKNHKSEKTYIKFGKGGVTKTLYCFVLECLY